MIILSQGDSNQPYLVIQDYLFQLAFITDNFHIPDDTRQHLKVLSYPSEQSFRLRHAYYRRKPRQEPLIENFL
jgi:hypothetical protein